MMKRMILCGALASLLAGGSYYAAAQQKNKVTKPTTGKTVLPAKKLPVVEVMLGNSASARVLPKRQYDQLAHQRLMVPGGGTVQGFTFTYAEHNLYEDSVGNPLRLTDYLVEYCTGDSLTAGIKSTLFERTKPGDTAYYGDIKVLLPDGKQAAGKALKFAISR